MKELFIIAFIGYLIIVLIWVLIGDIKKRRIDSTSNKEKEREYLNWLRLEEPKYRNLNKYPPDWEFRKIYAHLSCNYTCQSCGKTRFNSKKIENAKKERRPAFWTELHVHHIVPLSKGGDNSLSNLICLCEQCHENRHEWMLKIKLNFLTKN